MFVFLNRLVLLHSILEEAFIWNNRGPKRHMQLRKESMRLRSGRALSNSISSELPHKKPPWRYPICARHGGRAMCVACMMGGHTVASWKRAAQRMHNNTRLADVDFLTSIDFVVIVTIALCFVLLCCALDIRIGCLAAVKAACHHRVCV